MRNPNLTINRDIRVEAGDPPEKLIERYAGN